MSREPWYESENPTRVGMGFSWRFALWLIAAVLLIAAISIGVWAFRVGTSEVKGAGDAEIQINSGKNRIAAQEVFEAMYAQIQVYDRNLDQAAADKAANPSDAIIAQNYSGLVMICNDAVGQYNAEARKVGSAKWLTNDLPFEIDQTNPLFDCKESSK